MHWGSYFIAFICVFHRCLQEGRPCPLNIHPSQFSLIFNPPTDFLINPHIGPADTRCAVPLPRYTAEDRHFCRPLRDPLWTGQHLLSPHQPPAQIMSIWGSERSVEDCGGFCVIMIQYETSHTRDKTLNWELELFSRVVLWVCYVDNCMWFKLYFIFYCT